MNMKKKDRMEMSIIILNYMSFSDTIKYVNELSSQKNIFIEIIIVDNNSPNDSYIKLKEHFKGIQYISVIDSEKNGGYSFGNNYGLKYVIENNLPELVLISNNDIELNDELFLFNLIKQYERLPLNKGFVSPLMITDGKVSSVAARKLPTLIDEIIRSSNIIKKIVRKNNDYKIDQNEEYQEVDCLPGSFFLGKINLFKEIDFFDDNVFLYGEENILAYKIKDKKYSNYLLPKLNFFHNSSQTISDFYSEINQVKMRNTSKIYFWKNYMKISFMKINFLKLFLKYCEQELALIFFIRKVRNKLFK